MNHPYFFYDPEDGITFFPPWLRPWQQQFAILRKNFISAPYVATLRTLILAATAPVPPATNAWCV